MTLSSTLTQSQAMAAVNALRDRIGWQRPYTALDARVEKLPKWEVK